MRVADTLLVSLMISAAMASVPAYAQSSSSSSSELMAMDGQALVGELTKRYEAGLSASTDKGLIAANDPRFTWALETKVQCAIAMGFMKSSTKDETSISRCGAAYDRMNQPPAPPAVAVLLPPPPPPRLSVCNEKTAGMVFFDFDSSVISPDAQSTLASLGEQVKACARMSLSVVGHTDQAGSDGYNIALSRQRADVVAAAMRSIVGSGVKLNIDAQGERNPRVPLADGTRSPENRRVEISAE